MAAKFAGSILCFVLLDRIGLLDFKDGRFWSWARWFWTSGPNVGGLSLGLGRRVASMEKKLYSTLSLLFLGVE